MKRKALEDEVEESPVRKKCRITAWQRHLQKYASTEGSTTTIVLLELNQFCVKLVEGKEALGISHAFFNKKASAAYKELSSSEKEKLEQEVPSEYMSKQQVQRRVQRIFKSIQNQVSCNTYSALKIP